MCWFSLSGNLEVGFPYKGTLNQIRVKWVPLGHKAPFARLGSLYKGTLNQIRGTWVPPGYQVLKPGRINGESLASGLHETYGFGPETLLMGSWYHPKTQNLEPPKLIKSPSPKAAKLQVQNP